MNTLLIVDFDFEFAAIHSETVKRKYLQSRVCSLESVKELFLTFLFQKKIRDIQKTPVLKFWRKLRDFQY